MGTRRSPGRTGLERTSHRRVLGGITPQRAGPAVALWAAAIAVAGCASSGADAPSATRPRSTEVTTSPTPAPPTTPPPPTSPPETATSPPAPPETATPPPAPHATPVEATPGTPTGGTPTDGTPTGGTPPTETVPGPAAATGDPFGRAGELPSPGHPFGTITEPAPLPTPPPGRPPWIGTRVLPLRQDGFGEVGPTPVELEGRSFPTIDLLPPPISPAWYSDISPVPPEVLARSTWTPDCPVPLEELRWVRVSHLGFDGGVHTGEMILDRSVADDVVGAFREIFHARFPIESLRIATKADLVPGRPTGDGNDSGALTCRAARGSTRWSDHALGTAVDLNPFQNPYHRGDLVLPELASSYLDRDTLRPGMITGDGPVVAAFRRIGWGWGGSWRTSKDYMHFSLSGR